MRQVVKAEPASVTDPMPATFEDWARRLTQTGQVGHETAPDAPLHQIYDLMRQRHQVWLERVEEYGQVAIHSRPALERLLASHEHRDRARRQIERLTELLWRFESFHVALADTTPPLEMLIVGLDRALMVGAGTPTVGWGNWPFLLSWDDPKAVLMFVDDFWKNYYAIAPKARDKESVIHELCDLAGLAHPRHRQDGGH
jgi:hypothetical protein